MTKRGILFILLFALSIYAFLNMDIWRVPIQTDHRFKVYRDEVGVLRIVAKDKISMFYAMGNAQATDRLWTLSFKKRLVAGRLSELFGEAVLEMDLETRNFDFYNVGMMNAKLLDPESRAYLQAYADGINDYAKSLKLLPFQFYLTWAPWEDWTVEDSIAQIGFMSFGLEFDWMYELARQRLLETVGFHLAWKMIPFGEQNHFREVTIINNEELKQQKRYKQYKSEDISQILAQHWMNKTMPIDHIFMPSTEQDTLGSNAWAVGGKHTENGNPMLASDPHLGLSIPAAFHMMEMTVVNEDDEVQHQAFGIIVDGFPSLSIGVTKHIAWGSTASYVDNKDVFHERVREKNGTLEYLYNGQWKQLSVRKEEFKVRGGSNYIKEFYHTHRGPVVQHLLYEAHFKYGYPVPNKYRVNHTITISSAIYDPDSTSSMGLLNMMFSQSKEDFFKYTNLVQSINIDMAFIDREKNFGYVSMGRIPKREIPEMGSFVKDGSTDIYDMKGYYNEQEKMKLINPEKGYVAMANNKFAEDSFDLRGSIHEQTTGRSYRLEKIIQDKLSKEQKFSFDDFQAMQLDTRDEFLAEAFPSVLKGLQSVRALWSDSTTEEMFSRLQFWDYNLTKDSVEASIYHVWEHEFQESLLHGTDLSDQEREAIINHAFFEIYLMNLMVQLGDGSLGQEEEVLCQNTQYNTTDVHPCLANAALIFKKLPQILAQLFGTQKIDEWQWEKIHSARFQSPLFGKIPLLRHFFDRTGSGEGNCRTLNVGIITHQTKSYRTVGGAIFRVITDMDRTLFNFDTGQTDNIFSPFYDNFVGKKQYTEYIPLNPKKVDMKEWTIVEDQIK